MYHIRLFTADYPTVDTNSTFRREELIKTGHMIMPSLSIKEYYNDAKEIFGADVEIVETVYDMKQIQKEYDMRRPPERYERRGNYIKFLNMREHIEIHKDQAILFESIERSTHSIISYKTIVHWIDNGQILDFLTESFNKQNKPPFIIDSIILLTEDQIVGLCDMANAPIVKRIYENEKPLIFAYVLEE